MRTAKPVPRRHPVARLVAVAMLLGILAVLIWLIDSGPGDGGSAVGTGAEGDLVTPPPPDTSFTLAADAPSDEDAGEDAPPHRELPDDPHLFSFAEPELPPGMARIPAGTTVLGTPRADAEALAGGNPDESGATITRLAAEIPRHAVEVEEFLIDILEVSNLQWRTYLDATGRSPSPTLVEQAWPRRAIPEGHEQLPVDHVLLSEVRDYLAWCGKRLPTEAEWVRAGRGDDDRVYPWGDDWDPGRCRWVGSTRSRSVDVGRHPDGVSPFGVHDLAGNAFEWTDSPFVAFPGFRSFMVTRQRKTLRIEPEFDGRLQVIKGGAFHSERELCRLDFRAGHSPFDADAGLGFRGARTPEPAWDALHARLGRQPTPATDPRTRPDAGQHVDGKRLTLPDLLLDAKQFFGHEVTEWDAERRVVTGHRHVAFVPLFAGPLEPWLDAATGRISSGDPRRHRLEFREPLRPDTSRPEESLEPVMGLLSTSEALVDPPAPPGVYTVTFRPSRPPEGAADEGGTWGRFRLHPWRPEGKRPPHLNIAPYSGKGALSLVTLIDPQAEPTTQRFVQRSVSGIFNPLWLMALRDEAGRRVRLEFSIGELITTDDGLIARFHLDLEFEEAWLDG